MHSSFFRQKLFLIGEESGFFQVNNAYDVFDASGWPVARVQQRHSPDQALLRLFGSGPGHRPFTLDVYDAEGRVLVTIERNWTLVSSRVILSDCDGYLLGYLQQEFSLFKRKFRVLDAGESQVATIDGDWGAGEFSINDLYNEPMATISRQWSGFTREVLTTADQYVVSIAPDIQDEPTILVLFSTAIAMDMLFREGN